MIFSSMNDFDGLDDLVVRRVEEELEDLFATATRVWIRMRSGKKYDSLLEDLGKLEKLIVRIILISWLQGKGGKGI